MAIHVPMEELDVFKKFVADADEIWRLVIKWDQFAKETIGKQLVRAIDSVGANLVEGDCRHSQPDSIRFFRIARGSARESRYWIQRAAARNLLNPTKSAKLLDDLTTAVQTLNGLIAYRVESKSADRVREYSADLYRVASQADPFVDGGVDELAVELERRFQATQTTE